MSESFAEVGERRRKLAQQFQSAQISEVVGKDSRSVAEATMAADGTVQRISIDPEWRASGLDPADLAPAILEAIANCASARLADVVTQVGESNVSAQTPPLVGADPNLANEIVRNLGASLDEDGLRLLVERTRDLFDELDDLTEEAKASSTARYIGHSARREATATVSGTGDIIDLTFKASWLSSAHSINIGRVALAALTDAHGAVAVATAESISALDRVKTYQEMVGDPDKIAAVLEDARRARAQRRRDQDDI